MDRKRWTEWYQKKRKSATSAAPKPSNPAVKSQLDSNQEVLEIPSPEQDIQIPQQSEDTIYLEQPVSVEQTAQLFEENDLSGTDTDSDDDEEEDTGVCLNGQTFVQIVFWHPRK